MLETVEQQTLTDADIVKMAIRHEERGHHFYTVVARATGEPEIRQVFLKLAEEEREHARAFKQILDSVHQSGQNIFAKSSTEYIRAILERDLFGTQTVGERVTDVRDTKEAFALGIQAEKDAILFYHELYSNCQSQEAKRTLGKLLEAEKMHLVDLRNQMEDLH
ncbi:MAG: ferritin family protein [Clostridia bacterium]|nr:ferritin family protein [Clostridia bacterium]